MSTMSETELVVRERKKKRQKSLFSEPKEEGNIKEYSTQDQEPERRVRAREVYYGIRDEIKAESEKAKVQRELMEQEREKMREDFYTRRRTLYDLTKSELGNVAKVVLSDRTITLGKGRQHQRRHRKILGGLYHSDAEETTEIELRRSGAEEQ